MPNTPTDKRLVTLLAYHENAAATLRAALALLTNSTRVYARKAETNGHTNGHGHLPAAFTEALAIDATRRAKTKKKPAKRGRPRKVKALTKSVLARRQRSADLLARFDLRAPKSPEDTNTFIGALVRRGYLAKKGPGYVRTGKLFHVDPRESAKAAQ